MAAHHDQRPRRLGGWGFEGIELLPSAALLDWLGERLGAISMAPFRSGDIQVPLEGQLLPDFSVPASREADDRLRHAAGCGTPDLLRLRTGSVPALPDAVLRPASDDELESILSTCAHSGIRVIPWGGGTSVTGGVNVAPGDSPVVTLDLERLSGLEAIDTRSGLATFGAGTRGPALEEALAKEGFTLGHFPQSWELSTLGGWIATRASGQESLRYGSIHDLVAGLDLVAPAGRLAVPTLPASAAGPDLRQLVLGSEGRLGIISRATVRIRPRPADTEVEAWLLPGWPRGLDAARALLREAVPLSLLRLSDEDETEVALTLGMSGHPRLAPLVDIWLKLRGVGRNGALMLCGAAGTAPERDEIRWQSAAVLKRYGGVSLGIGPGRKWLADRFRHPYLRDSLLDIGIATDTVETATTWSNLGNLANDVRTAIREALAGEDEAVAVLCHLSHPYPDGASLYFTFFYRCPADVDAALERWRAIKNAATEAIVSGGGALSHHHGVGRWHAPWLSRETGELGARLLTAAAATADPDAILNPQVLLDPRQHLEI